MLVLTFSWKNFFMFIFSLFFKNNAIKSCAPFIEFLFSHEKFLQGKILPRSPLPSPPPPPQPKIILERSVHFQIFINTCKRWSKLVTCSPFPGDSGGVSEPETYSGILRVSETKTYLWCFSTMLNKIAISKLWSVDFGKKWAWEGA